jgi:predicted ATP-grasp superfamily ATP-dependent carboligase
MMNPQKPYACVMGDIDLLRPLGMAGIPCVVVTKPGTMPRYSRYAKRSLEYNDPWQYPEKVVDELMRFGLAQEERPILFYEHDALLKIVSKYRDELTRAFRFIIAETELVDEILDKYKFHELAERTGLPVPKTRLIDAASESDWNSIDISFPFIIKPVTRSPRLWDPVAGTAKAANIGSSEDLEKFKRRFLNLETKFELIAQQLVAGPESAIESYQVYVDVNGDVAGEFTGKKIRTFPVELGHSCSLTITDDEDLVQIGRDLAKRINLRGVAEFEFKRSPSGELFLLEINPRFNLWHHLGAAAGVNLPAMVYNDLAGLPQNTQGRARAGTRWCRMWKDLRASRAEGIPLTSWFKWAMSCEVKRGFTWDDPFPLFAGGVWRTYSNLSHAIQLKGQSV